MVFGSEGDVLESDIDVEVVGLKARALGGLGEEIEWVVGKL